jgi:hypothetical protein
MDLKVMIHFNKETSELYYKSPQQEKMNVDVTASQVKSVKTTSKTKS